MAAAPRAAATLLRQCCRDAARPAPRQAHGLSRTATASRLPRLAIASPRCRALSTSPSNTSSASSSSSSVSPDEVAHFNALASAWWDPHGSSRLLHQMNPLRHDFIRACVASQGPGQGSDDAVTERIPRRILDIGCGGGIFAESAARLPTTASVTAIDPSPEVLAVARAHARRDPLLCGGDGRLTYRQASIEDLSAEQLQQPQQQPQQFDMVSLFEVLEHVATDPEAFLAHCGRLLRPGGWLVLSTMARTWTSWLTTVVAAEDVLGIVPRGTHDWRKYVNADELLAYFASMTAHAGDSADGGGVSGGASSSSSSSSSSSCAWQLDSARFRGVAYVPGLGWQVVPGGEKLGNYFFGIRKAGGEAEEGSRAD